MKRIHSAVIGALALTFAGASLAAGSSDMSGSSGSMSSSGASSAAAQTPDLSKDFKSTDLIGLNVSNRQNQNLGSISNLIVDPSGKISYVVLNQTGGTTAAGSNKYIVPWSRVTLTPGQNVAMVDVDPNALPSEFAAFDESMTAQVSGTTQNPPSGGSSNMSPPPASGGGSGGMSGGSSGGTSGGGY